MSKKIYREIDEFLFKNDTVEIEDLLIIISDLINQGEPTPKTIATRYSNVKNFIRNNYGAEFTEKDLKLIKPEASVTTSILESDIIRRSEAKNIIYNDDLIKKILDLKDNHKNDYELALYLQFISGRRVDEIKSTEYITKPFKDTIKMKLSKCKTEDKCQIKLIPDTLNSKDFKKMLDNMRSRNVDISTNDWNKRLNKTIKKVIRSDLTTHNLRGLYASWMFNKFNPENQNINGFITKILNHSSTDASLNYSKYKYQN